MASKEVTKAKPTKVEVFEIQREGHKIILPAHASIPAVIESLTRKHAEEEETILLKEVFDFYPSEGAVALGKVLSRRYGFVIQEAEIVKGMFGGTTKVPPGTIAVEVGWRRVIQVPWNSKVAVPGLGGGVVVPRLALKNGMPVFELIGQFAGKYRGEFMELCQDLRDTVARESIYHGAALEFRWPENDDPSETPPDDWFPRFLDPASASSEDAVFPEQTKLDIEARVYGPVRFTGSYTEAKMSLRTGVLLHGPYGCGKTLVLSVLKGLCIRHGWGFVYCPSTRILLRALQFVQTSGHGPTVLACEDMDTFVDHGGDINLLQNRLDGVDSKGIPVKLVTTTNHIERIEERMPALTRDGRLGVHIPIGAPDKDAAERLIRKYAGSMLHPTEPLALVGVALQGWLPAQIAGVVEAAQQYALTRQEGFLPVHLTEGDLLAAAGHQKEAAQRARDAYTKAHAKEMPLPLQVAHVLAEGMQAGAKGNGAQVPAHVSAYAYGADLSGGFATDLD